MANKALATRQRMQFRVEPSQAPGRLRNPALKTETPMASNPRPASEKPVLLGKLLAAANKSDLNK